MAERCEKIKETLAEGLGTIVFLMVQGSVIAIPPEFVDMALSKYYKMRQLFALSCKKLSYWDKFVKYFGSLFEELCKDKVDNVRICCAMAAGEADNRTSPEYWERVKAILAHDYDTDVRYFVARKHGAESPILRVLREVGDSEYTWIFDTETDCSMEWGRA